MARKKQGFTASFIDTKCTGVDGRKVLYRHGSDGLGLSVDRRYEGVRKAFFFEGKIHGQTIRRVIGDWPTWTVENAAKAARELRVKLDNGTDPREEARQAKVQAQQEAQVRKARQASLRDAWESYLANRAASSKPLSALTIRDYNAHLRRSFNDWADGKLTAITEMATVAKHKALLDKSGPAQANQAMRYLRAVLNYAKKSPDYSASFNGDNPVRKLTEDKAWADVKPNKVTLRRDQLRAWWDASEHIENPVARTYLRFLLICGCRREEALSLKWSDVDFRWGSITFRDTKTGGDRVIPLTKYAALALGSLPRRNEWVFSSEQSADGRMREPAKYIKAISDKTGIWVSSHGLRKSFATLSEWIEIPSGVIRQITGHVAGNDAHEAHYRHRPLDMLAMHAQRFEDWILAEAGGSLIQGADAVGLRVAC